MNNVECDILIIGSGAAGGTLAATLSEFLPDRKIVVVEKGGFFTRTSFDQRELDMNVLYAERGARTTIDGAFPVEGGECVGGGTTINFALSFNPIQKVWEHWKAAYGVSGYSFEPAANDYGVPNLNIPTCLREVRARINVHHPSDHEVNDNNRLFADGCRRLGVSAKRFELNMRGCIGCGYCGQGCAYDHKQGTMITYVADALHRGVQLIHHCAIDTLTFESHNGSMAAGTALGSVRPTSPGSQPNTVPPGPISIVAKLIVLSAGTVESPALLQRSGYPDRFGTVGRGLVLHPSLPIAGIFGEKVTNFRGITGSMYSDHYYQTHGFYYECLFDHPVNASVAVPSFGAQHFETMLDYTRLAAFGVMLVDSVSSENRVVTDPSSGRPVIFYRLGEADKSRLRFAAQRGVEIMFAAGAKEVFLTSDEPIGDLEMPRFRREEDAASCSDLEFRPNQTLLSSAHCQASLKMGSDPKTSTVDSRCETHFVRNLIVCDSSAFPTSCGANPMLSIMTMARYQGKRIAAESARYFE